MKLINSISEFESSLKSSDSVIVMFSAVWCAPCKLISPHFEKLKHDNILSLKVDISILEDLSKKYNITSLPTFILFKHSKEIERETNFSKISKFFK